MKKILFIFLTLIGITTIKAQIGYQVAVRDQYSGEPKTNTPVSVYISIVDNEGGTVFSETYISTTNDFGIASLQIGNDKMFDNMNWEKLPLYITATIDDTIELPTTQILSVPVAEYAKRSGTEILTQEILCSKRWKGSKHYFEFFENYQGNLGFIENYDDPNNTTPFDYSISGNMVLIYYQNKMDEIYQLPYDPIKNILVDTLFNNRGDALE